MSRLAPQEQEFLKAVQSGSVGAVRKLLADGYSPNVAAHRPDITPLHEAVIQGDLLMVKVLVAGGAALNAADRLGDFPLDTAIYEDRDTIAKYLRGIGARRHDEDDLSPPQNPAKEKPVAAGDETTVLARDFARTQRDRLHQEVDGDAFRLAPRRKPQPPRP